MINSFNKYANETNKDIQLQLTYFTDVSNVVGYNDYSSTLSLLGKKNSKYDIFAYDANYLSAFSPYLMELDNYLPKNFTDLYSSKYNRMLNYYNGHIRGFPFFLIFSVLFSNEKYLQKYNKRIPKSWDELLNTAKYIVDEEKKMNNDTNLVGYTGLFPDNENAMCSIFQLIHSYRDNADSEIPEFTSQNAKDAFYKILEIRDKISSNEWFRISETQIVDHLFNGNILFAHFYSSLTIPLYSMSVLPGRKDGINSSIIGGYSIGIYKYISEEKKEAALEVIKYFSSKEFQKEVIVKQLGLITALEELYDDSDVCKFINCDMLHEIQYYLRPISTMENYNDFSKRAMKYFQELLDGEKKVEDTLNNINDINRIYFITWKNTLGAILISFLVIIFIIVIIATSLIFISSFQSYFTFLSNDLWIIYTIGSISLLASAFEYFSLPSKKKCILRQTFYINGESLIYIPLICKLTINYPIINKFSTWVEKHKLIYVASLYSIQLLSSILNAVFGSIGIKEINLDKSEKNFYICANNSTVGKAFTQIQYFYTLLLYFSICIFLFFEWNIEQTYFDIRHFSFAIIMDGISIALHYLFDFHSINSYILYNILFIFINIIKSFY